MTSYERSNPNPARWSFKGALFTSILALGGLCLVGWGVRYLRALYNLRHKTITLQVNEPLETPVEEASDASEVGQSETIEVWRLNLQKDIEASQEEELDELPESLVLNKVNLGPHSVHFAANSCQPDAKSATSIVAIAESLKAHPELQVCVVGYADSSEESENIIHEEGLKELSLKRAEAVAQMLKEHGVEPEKIQSRGEGSAFPIDLNRAQASPYNRRVMLLLISFEADDALAEQPKQPQLTTEGKKG